MNIFALSQCPEQSALWLDDVRKTKMILESAQMLSTAIRVLDPDTDLPVYRIAHLNHPCSIWARQSRANFRWLIEHMTHMWTQKSRPHKSAGLLPYFRQFAFNAKFPQEELTLFANCARNLERGVDFSGVDDVHDAYKMYMRERWKENTIKLSWVWGEKPHWK